MKKVILAALVVFCATTFYTSCSKSSENNSLAVGDQTLASTQALLNDTEIVYVQTNDPDQNAIVAYQNNGNGQLQQLPGSPFLTGGKGINSTSPGVSFANASDNEVILSNDHRFLLAVNSGSNTIAVFSIQPDGTLSAVPGSPFPSGGVMPVSLAHWQQYIYVANKSSSYNQAPNYIAFRLEGDGSLSAVPGARADLPTTHNNQNSFTPCQVLVSRNNPFLFGAEFTNNISNRVMNSNGSLGFLPGSPNVPAADVYGLCQHTTKNILYAGFPQEGKTGVYEIVTTTGALSFITSLTSGSGASNMRINNGGNHLYVLNSYLNAVALLNTFDPGAPTVLGRLTLKNPGVIWRNHAVPYPSSQCASLGLSWNEQFLYVVSQNTNWNYSPDTANNNRLHVLTVQADGTLTEPGEPIQLPVSRTAFSRGVAVYHISGQ